MKENELKRIENYLSEKHYTLKKEWLTTCIEYIESRVQATLNFEQIVNMVVFEFLNSDIENSYAPCMKIPLNAAKMFVTRKMIFQIVSYINISRSVFDQLSEATRHNNDLSWFHGGDSVPKESDEDHSSENKRTQQRGILKLELTDGLNKLFAVETQDETFDIKDVIPGAKVILIDKVKSRNGVLLFNRSNCQILGGWVEKLQYNLSEKFAKLLKIDLYAETKRKKLAIEKAAEMRKQRKEKQNLTQSSISPFLVKKDKPKMVTLDKSDSFDDIHSDDKLKNHRKSATQDVIVECQQLGECTFTPIKSSSTIHVESSSENGYPKATAINQPGTSNSTVFEEIDSWAFTSKPISSNAIVANSPIEVRSNQIKADPQCGVNRRKTKELSRELLDESNCDKEPIEIYKPGKLSIPKRSNNEESVLHSNILRTELIGKNLWESDNPDDIVKPVSEMFSKSIHGPRGIVKNKAENMKRQNHEKTNELITNFFNTVKSLGKKSDDKKQENIKLKLKGVVAPIQNGELQKEILSPKEDSILECTIEREGIEECERWGIDLLRKPPKRQHEFDRILMSPDVLTHKLPNVERNHEIKKSEIVDMEESKIPPKKNCPSMFEQNTVSRVPHLNVNNQRAVIRQSDNVQIYKTPLAKRIPSSDNSNQFIHELLNRFSLLNVVPLKDALTTRKYWMMSKIVVIMPTICHQMHPIQCNGIDWELKLRIADISISNVSCFVSTELLNRIFGFTVRDCKKLYEDSKMDILQAKKHEAEQKLSGFKRLDLIMWLEISPQFQKFPVVVDVKTISDAMNIL